LLVVKHAQAEAGNSEGPIDIQAMAEEAIAALRAGRQIAPFSSRLKDFDLETAYRVAAVVRQLRAASGENSVGRKIGFTNRAIWTEYGVYAPIWGYLYDGTVRHLDDIAGVFPLAGLCEPRIEPEVAFRLARAPEPDMDEGALLACVDWIALAFEIVQSLYPGWMFSASDTVAAFGLHGALLVGRRTPVEANAEDWLRSLSAFDIDLKCNGVVADHGHSSHVLGGPLSALRHLVGVLAHDPLAPPLAPGEIVTTGTLTRALPIAEGETWATELTGVALEPISVTLV
jgi:2-oxo-3-hexenedioate decarboxylase